MTENGKRYPARTLYEAFVALVEIGRATKPQIGQDGVQRAALLHLPADGIGMRFALCRNSLRPIAETIEEKQNELQEEHGVKNASIKTPAERQALVPKIEAYNKAQAALMKEEIAWQCPAPVRVAQIGDRELSPEWLGALAAADIITGEPTPDEPDKKK